MGLTHHTSHVLGKVRSNFLRVVMRAGVPFFLEVRPVAVVPLAGETSGLLASGRC